MVMLIWNGKAQSRWSTRFQRPNGLGASIPADERLVRAIGRGGCRDLRERVTDLLARLLPE
jgi:hypothetical protein